VGEVDEEAPRGEVRIGEDSGVVVQPAAGDPRRLEVGHPRLGRPRRRHGLDDGGKRACVRVTARRVAPARVVVRQPVGPDERAKRGPGRGRRRAEYDMAIGGAERLIRRDDPVGRSEPLGDLAGGEVDT